MAKNRASLKMPEKKKEMCLSMLREGKYSKREIANKLKINSGYVYRLAAENNIGQQKEKENVVDIDTTVVAEDAKEVLQDIVGSVLEDKQEVKVKEEVVEVCEDNEKEVKTLGGKLSQEDKIQIAILCEEGNLNRQDIGKKFGVSGTTVSNIAKELGLPPAPRGGIRKPTGETVSTISELNQRDISEIFKGSHVYCGLISERHDIPCESFIFTESLQPSQMHDYDWQYQVCKNYIDTHIEFTKYRINNQMIASADLICYMTGFQAALGALVKACFESGVNLTLMHYDTDIHDYHSQVIFDHFNDKNNTSKESYLAPFLEQYNKAFFYKCTETDVENVETFFVVNRVNIGNNNVYDRNTKKDAIQEAFICKSDGDAWELYPKLAKNIMSNTDDNICLYLIPVDQEEGSWIYNNAYAKTYNFKTEAKTRY